MKRDVPLRRIGLARVLSKLGYCSRSQASALVRAGRVQLNGRVRRDPETPAHLEKDRIEVDGHRILRRQKIYFMLHKPRGLVTTTSDEQGRQTVYECLGEGLSWLAPVGRLDKASEGLLLFTNDSEWAARILAPETHLKKIYHVHVAALIDQDFILKLQSGVRVAGGEVLCAKEVRILRQGIHNTWIEVVLDEGRNRQIRRMLQPLRVEILRLMRVAIGPLRLGNLAKGAFRELTPVEKSELDDAMQPENAADRKPEHRPAIENLSCRRKPPSPSA